MSVGISAVRVRSLRQPFHMCIVFTGSRPGFPSSSPFLNPPCRMFRRDPRCRRGCQTFSGSAKARCSYGGGSGGGLQGFGYDTYGRGGIGRDSLRWFRLAQTTLGRAVGRCTWGNSSTPCNIRSSRPVTTGNPWHRERKQELSAASALEVPEEVVFRYPTASLISGFMGDLRKDDELLAAAG